MTVPPQRALIERLLEMDTAARWKAVLDSMMGDVSGGEV